MIGETTGLRLFLVWGIIHWARRPRFFPFCSTSILVMLRRFSLQLEGRNDK